MKRRLSVGVALATLLATIGTVLAMATPALADYGYTVRVFPGNRGKFSTDIVSVTVPKGDNLNLYDIATATITDDRYVQTGFRQSGTDTLLGNGQINGVTEDMDFVVAYGVEANIVSYRLEYVEYGTGKELAQPKTYYGKEGDKPVVAYEYIEGYRPRYLAITGTLHKDEENVWTFEYIPLAEGETAQSTTSTTRYVDQPTESETATAGGADAGTTGGTNQNTNATAEETTTAEDAPPTQEILDLDTPLAGPDSGRGILGSDALLLSAPAMIASGCIGVAVIAGLVFFFVKRRKAKQDAEA